MDTLIGRVYCTVHTSYLTLFTNQKRGNSRCFLYQSIVHYKQHFSAVNPS